MTSNLTPSERLACNARLRRMSKLWLRTTIAAVLIVLVLLCR